MRRDPIMRFERRLAWSVTVLAVSLAVAAVSAVDSSSEPGAKDAVANTCTPDSEGGGMAHHAEADGADAEGCSVTEREYRADDGSRRAVKRVTCDDGSVRTFEHKYDENGRLELVREHEITANGAVRLVEDSGADSPPALDAGTKGTDSTLPDVGADETEPEQIQDWLNAKFKEWNDDVEAQEAARRRSREAGGN
jgi:hypothetical protein